MNYTYTPPVSTTHIYFDSFPVLPSNSIAIIDRCIAPARCSFLPPHTPLIYVDGGEAVKSREEKARLGWSPFAEEQYRHQNPVDWIVKQQKRHATLALIGDDPEAYIAAEIARRTAPPAPTPALQPAIPAAAAPTPQAAPPAPAAPRSIVSAPNAGSQHTVATGPGRAFEAAFPI